MLKHHSACAGKNPVDLKFGLLKALLFVTDPSANLHDQLAEVLALQQAEERLRRLGEAVDDGLAALELAGFQQPADLGHELGQHRCMIGHDEALDGEAALDRKSVV